MTIADTAIVDPSANIGKNVRIADFVVVGAGAVVGDDVTLDAGCVIAAAAGLTTSAPIATHIGSGSFIGARAVVVAGVHVGDGAVVRPGAVVSVMAPPLAVLSGNPAEVVDYVTAFQAPLVTLDIERLHDDKSHLPRGVAVRNLDRVVDLRGALTIADIDNVPFSIARAYFVSGVGEGLIRGAHAHRACHQLLIAVQGGLTCVVDDGERRVEVRMTNPGLALHISPMVWGTQYQFETGSVLGVLASQAYDKHEYITDYATFLEEVSRGHLESNR
jgi:UDP-2-acetamido-3-amino-2,3-dideoxy-glucuronate N-acetyltransferase